MSAPSGEPTPQTSNFQNNNDNSNTPQGDGSAATPMLSVRTAGEGRNDVPPGYIGSKEDEPPSYESLFGKVKSIQNKSLGHIKCADRLRSSLAARIVLRTVTFLLFMGVPLAMLVVGAININQCPAARLVPIYMVVAGSTVGIYFIVIIIRKIVTYCRRKLPSNNDNNEADNEAKPVPTHPLWRAFDGVVNLFIIGWFIAGNCIVYTAWIQRPACVTLTSAACTVEDTFCDPTLLLTAFWIITGTYITCGCCTCSGICIGCVLACVKQK